MSARAWIERVVGPPLDALLSRLDPSVTAQSHRDVARGILKEAAPPGTSPTRAAVIQHSLCDLAGEPAPAPAPVSAVSADGFRADGYEVGAAEREAHLVGLVPGALRWEPRSPFGPEPAGESATGGRAVGARAWSHFAGGGALDDPWIDALEQCVLARPEARWFLRSGTAYGNAATLRALIAASRVEPRLTAIARRLSDRLLRHVEVRREACLSFLPAGLPPDAEPELERARFTLVLLDAASTWEDLRYLNAALKLTDWRHGHLRGKTGAAGVSLVHAVAVARQERLLREWGEA